MSLLETSTGSLSSPYLMTPQEYLLFEAALESTRSDIDRELDENRLPEDPEARLEMLIDAFQEKIVDKEAAFRTMLKFALVFLAGSVSSAVMAYLAIKFLLRFLANHSLWVFAYYRFVLVAEVAVALLSAST